MKRARVAKGQGYLPLHTTTTNCYSFNIKISSPYYIDTIYCCFLESSNNLLVITQDNMNEVCRFLDTASHEVSLFRWACSSD